MSLRWNGDAVVADLLQQAVAAVDRASLDIADLARAKAPVSNEAGPINAKVRERRQVESFDEYRIGDRRPNNSEKKQIFAVKRAAQIKGERAPSRFFIDTDTGRQEVRTVQVQKVMRRNSAFEGREVNPTTGRVVPRGGAKPHLRDTIKALPANVEGTKVVGGVVATAEYAAAQELGFQHTSHGKSTGTLVSPANGGEGYMRPALKQYETAYRTGRYFKR